MSPESQAFIAMNYMAQVTGQGQVSMPASVYRELVMKAIAFDAAMCSGSPGGSATITLQPNPDGSISIKP